MAHSINWFEIPVDDFERAKIFYEKILNTEMPTMEAMGMTSAFFPADFKNGEIGGCIIKGKDYKPSASGTVVYLNAGEDLNPVLSKVEEAGGKVIMPRMSIGENGFMAYFADTEGNKIGLHSRK